MESSQLNAIRELLPNKVIIKVCNECDYYFRERIFTPLVTIFHMIGAAISREESFQSSWHNIGETGNSDTLSKARKRLPVAVWKKMHRWITAQIKDENKAVSLWRGHRVIGVDGTCVSMSDEAELRRVFGKSGSRQGRSRFPIARTVFGFDLFNITAVDMK